MPCECNGDGRVADGSRDEPHDHDSLKLLEVLEVGDVVDVDCAAYAADYDHCLVREIMFFMKAISTHRWKQRL